MLDADEPCKKIVTLLPQSYGRKEKEKTVLGKVSRIELPPPGAIYIRTRRIKHTAAVVTRDDITKNVISNDFN